MSNATSVPLTEFDEKSLYRTLFSAYPDALLLVGADGRIVLANPQAAELLGYSELELTELTVDDLVPDALRSRHAAHRESYASSPRTRPMGTQMELAAKRRDGSEVMVEIALSPLQSHGLPYVVAAIRGIGAYPRVAQALQRARYSEHIAQISRLAADTRDLQVLLKQIPTVAAQALLVDVAVVYLLEPHQLEFRVASGIGLVPGEAEGDHVAHRADTPPGFAVSEGKPVTVLDYRSEDRFHVPQAYLDAGLTSGAAVPLSDRGRTVGALVVRSKRAQRFGADEIRFLESLSNLLATSLQRAETEAALSHSQRLESVGQLTGGIAHDFNNLLTIIQGNLQVLEEHASIRGDAHAQQLVGAATRASRRGAVLTGKLLAFSRRQVLQPSRVDISALLQSLADMLRRTVDQRIRIRVDAPLACPPCLADAGQLESALLNIAINARDAMPDGGVLSFKCEPCWALPPQLQQELDASNTVYVAISVTDSGAGMPDAVKARAFEPFFTTKEAGRGTGLGLSTVYGFVKQSKGAIVLDSAIGAGTTVTLYIPRFGDVSTATNDAERTVHAVRPGLRVLLVEDEFEVRSVARRFLSSLGCEVTESASAEQALLTLTPDSNFDLLLTDIALGAGMRGTELARRVQQRAPNIAVLLMSGYSADLLDADAGCPSGWELLRKPYTRAELADAIAKVSAATE